MRLENGCRNGGQFLKLKKDYYQGELSRIRMQMRDNDVAKPEVCTSSGMGRPEGES